MIIPLFSARKVSAELAVDLRQELGIELQRYPQALLPELQSDIRAQLGSMNVGKYGPVAVDARVPAHIVERIRRLGHPVLVIVGGKEARLLPGLLEFKVTHPILVADSDQHSHYVGYASEEIWPSKWADHPWAVRNHFLAETRTLK